MLMGTAYEEHYKKQEKRVKQAMIWVVFSILLLFLYVALYGLPVN